MMPVGGTNKVVNAALKETAQVQRQFQIKSLFIIDASVLGKVVHFPHHVL